MNYVFLGIIILLILSYRLFSRNSTKNNDVQDELPGVPGPTPWYYKEDGDLLFADEVFHWHHEERKDPGYAHYVCLRNKKNKNLLFLGMYVYACQIDAKRLLLWKVIGKSISIVLIDVSLLTEVPLPEDDQNELFYKADERAVLCRQTLFFMEEGTHSVEELKAFSIDADILILADYITSETNKNNMYQAVYDFDFENATVTVYPQKWFNENEQIDFGYQWITRVTKNEDGRITGSGIRLGYFELDETNMYLDKDYEDRFRY